MKVSVIVPVLNEAKTLPDLLLHLRTWVDGEAEGFHKRDRPDTADFIEVIWVDGGSSDSTVGLIQGAGYKVAHAGRGRARQMNLGAASATADVLLFLHADNTLPEDWLQAIQVQLVKPACWGRFDVNIQGQSLMLPVIAWFMNWRSRLSGIATGDQAMFMTRQSFESVGGFPDQPLMEDIEMSRRLRRISRPACIASKTNTSGRRWETRGVWKTIFLMWRLRWAYWRGQPASQLAKQYS